MNGRLAEATGSAWKGTSDTQDHTPGPKPKLSVSEVWAFFSVPWPPQHTVASWTVHEYTGALRMLPSLRPPSILDAMGWGLLELGGAAALSSLCHLHILQGPPSSPEV